MWNEDSRMVGWMKPAIYIPHCTADISHWLTEEKNRIKGTLTEIPQNSVNVPLIHCPQFPH
jgi:hypothetical protein